MVSYNKLRKLHFRACPGHHIKILLYDTYVIQADRSKALMATRLDGRGTAVRDRRRFFFFRSGEAALDPPSLVFSDYRGLRRSENGVGHYLLLVPRLRASGFMHLLHHTPP